MLENIGLVSYSVNLVGYLVLVILLAVSWRKGVFGAYLIIAVCFEIIWSAILAYHSLNVDRFYPDVFEIEVLRASAWNIFLLKLLELSGIARKDNKLYRSLVVIFGVCISFSFLSLLWPGGILEHIEPKYFFILALLSAVVAIVLIEQLYRNLKHDQRWRIKFLCVGSAALFVYDFYVYADALLVNQIDFSLWDARGIVNLLVVPVLAVTVARLPDLSFDLFVSRQVVFFTSGLIVTGAYLLMMALGGYYIRSYGGSWSNVAQVVFLVTSIMILLVVFLSSHIRGKLKQFISKHFYKNKYDYKEEWMRLIHSIYEYQEPEYFKKRIIQAMADIVQCRGGVLYLQTDEGYECDASWNAMMKCQTIEASAAMVQYLNYTESVIDLHEFQQNKEKYPELEIPECITNNNSAWLIIPLKLHYSLVGFMVLLESSIQEYINWEDRDLFKAAGRQISSYLSLIQTSEELAEARQFSAFNRLSAYLVHDLKNLVSQLELITVNAAKHKSDPEFIEDTILTVQNVVIKARRMLGQLRKLEFEPINTNFKVNVSEIVKRVVANKSTKSPAPSFEEAGQALYVNVEPERFENVIEHLVQNAQEATQDNDIIAMRVSKENSYVVIEIRDTGCGMDKTFIKERLFKPFDTTKGNAGMGIGVFEAREFVKRYGGIIEVDSEPGTGTTFYIKIPESKEVVS